MTPPVAASLLLAELMLSVIKPMAGRHAKTDHNHVAHVNGAEDVRRVPSADRGVSGGRAEPARRYTSKEEKSQVNLKKKGTSQTKIR